MKGHINMRDPEPVLYGNPRFIGVLRSLADCVEGLLSKDFVETANPEMLGSRLEAVGQLYHAAANLAVPGCCERVDVYRVPLLPDRCCIAIRAYQHYHFMPFFTSGLRDLLLGPAGDARCFEVRIDCSQFQDAAAAQTFPQDT